MAIAIDNEAQGNQVDSVTTQTTSFTCTGDNRYLVVGFQSGSAASGVTYDGVAMTQLSTETSPGGTNIYQYGLAAPSTGANDIVITIGSTGSIGSGFVSFTGAAQTGQPDAEFTETNAGSNTVSTSVTTTVDNCWTVAFWRDDAGRLLTPGAGTTEIADESGKGYHMVRSTDIVASAGVSTLTGTLASTAPAWAESIISLSSHIPHDIKTRNTVAIASIKTTNTVT